MESHAADLVVVGSGMAGLACALAFPGRVLLVTKTDVPESGSSWLARGGIAAAVGPGDSPALHAADTLAVAGGIAESAAVEALTAAAPETVEALVGLGVPFGRTADGSLSLGREAAHRFPRIVHAGGDATGRHVVDALLRAVRARPNVTVLEGCFAFDLLASSKGGVCGLLAYDDARGWLVLRSTRVVLATGGIGALYAETTNPPEATGDGLAIAARAGAELADLEFVQFHPTALAAGDRPGLPLPLLSEALRGAGALLVDDRGERFMAAEDARAELAPRDVVARAVFRRRAAGREVLLDLRPALRAGGAAFPSAVEACRRAGYEPETFPVPVRPAAHYHMGGVRADGSGRTSVPGLWACGEVAATGVHGANRLASNSLLDAVVMGGRVAADAVAHLPPPCASAPAIAVPVLPDPVALLSLREGLQRLASRRLGVERDRAGLEAALAEAAEARRAISRLPAGRLGGGSGWLAAVRAYGELRNLRLVARLVAATALAREESRGAHFRRDHPEPRPEWCRRQVVTLAGIAADAAAEAGRREPAALLERAA